MLTPHARQVGVAGSPSPHGLCATGITIYPGYGGTLEHVQFFAAHASPRTTQNATTSRMTELTRAIRNG